MSDKIALTKPQVRKLLKHQGVQLKPEQIGAGILLHKDFPMKQRKALAKAHRQRKGMRLKFSPQELVMGSGFWDWIKSAAETVYNVVAKPLVNVAKSAYKPLAEVARPLVRQYAPEIAKAASTYTGIPITTEQVLGAEKLSKDILGVGVGKGRVMRARGGAMRLSDNSSTMMAPQHPVFGFQPQFTGHDIRRVIEKTSSGGDIVLDPRQAQNVYGPPVSGRGGMKGAFGFKPAGYGFRPSGY